MTRILMGHAAPDVAATAPSAYLIDEYAIGLTADENGQNVRFALYVKVHGIGTMFEMPVLVATSFERGVKQILDHRAAVKALITESLVRVEKVL